MYTDIAQWKRFRALVLIEGQCIKAVGKAEKLHPRTVKKMLLYEKPPGYTYTEGAQKGRPTVHNIVLEKLITQNHRQPQGLRLSTSEMYRQLQEQGLKGSLNAVFYHRRRHEDTDEAHLWRTLQHIVRSLPDDDGTNFLASLFPKGALAGKNNAAAQRRRKIHLKSTELARSHVSRESWARAGWDRWLSKLEQTGQYDSRILSKEDTRYLLDKILPEKKINRKKALVLLAQDQDLPVKYVAKFLGMSPRDAYSYMNAYKRDGVTAPFFYRLRPKKENDDTLKKMVFTLLHEPPSLSGINRTSWRLDDLERVLKEKGFSASYRILHNIIKDAGYRWKSARTVLTSHDPAYKVKLAHIQDVLSNLQDDERFFSIDEFGPFSVRMRAGCLLSPPEVQPIVPQFQKSKGVLICTAALELSRNQVTHFFSSAKNSEEMIKLASVLIDRYSTVKTLYLSWDAASWHKSRSLLNFIETHNNSAISKHLPLLEIVELPASAQFLNIIESVFSGMAKAIIHNSNYASKDDAIFAIDRYLAERNQHYIDHPKAAGKKIWGKSGHQTSLRRKTIARTSSIGKRLQSIGVPAK